MTTESLPRCTQSSCSAYHQFTWYGPDACKATFICSTMTGNVCGDHELALTFTPSAIDTVSDSSTVCYKGHSYHGTLEQFDTLDITIWYSSEAEVQSNCYFWCTGDGSIPILPTTEAIDQNIILSLVCYNNYCFCILLTFSKIIYTLTPATDKQLFNNFNTCCRQTAPEPSRAWISQPWKMTLQNPLSLQ